VRAVTLRDLAVGDTGRVTGLEAGNPAYRRRLLAMGLTPGTEFTVTRFAPLGDPVQIAIRGFSLSLRRDEADIVRVERSP
jgi:Fe2+ transport system protein FeoA